VSVLPAVSVDLGQRHCRQKQLLTYAHEVVALFNEKFYEKDIVKDDMESIFKEEMSAEEKLKEIEDYFND